METTTADTSERARTTTTACIDRRTPAIERTVEDRLRGSGYLALRHVACFAWENTIYLRGQLPTYFLKQLAQEIAAGAEGVRRVINRIDVQRTARPEAMRLR